MTHLLQVDLHVLVHLLVPHLLLAWCDRAFELEPHCLQCLICQENEEWGNNWKYWNPPARRSRTKTACSPTPCFNLLGAKSMAIPRSLTTSRIFAIVEFGSSNSWKNMLYDLGCKFPCYFWFANNDLWRIKVATSCPDEPGWEGGEQEELLPRVGRDHEVVPE